MTDIAKTLQRQSSDSGLIILYELEYSTGNVAYFYAGLDENSTAIQFRQTDGTVKTYTAIPLTAEGFDVSSDGSYSRPELSVGNIGNILTNAIGGIDVEDLTGKRVTRRTTLEKYLVGESGDATPPVEFPKVTYIIDRIKQKNILSVTFELVSPFDLTGVALPRRSIIAGSCPFRYKNASPSVSRENRRGGCSWDAKFIGTTNPLFMNKFDEYIVPSTLTFNNVGGNMTAGSYYKSAASLTSINADGTSSTYNSDFNYWQCISSTSTAPSDTATQWRRVRVYYAYSSSATYYGFTDKKFNHFILESGVLWQVKNKTETPTHSARIEGENWTVGDVCGKRVASCRLRFQALEQTGVSGGISLQTDSNKSLPFGGFPSVQRRR